MVVIIPYIEFKGSQWFRNSLNYSDLSFDNGNVLEKIQFFRLVLELRVNSEFFQLFKLEHFQLPRLGFLFVIKYYFNSAQNNFNNRPSHQVTVSPNWSWM